MDRDRNRLSGVHRSEQSSESRVNEDFVDWLKTKGPTYLLVVLLGLAAYLGYVRLTEGRAARHATAWSEFQEAEVSGLPSSYESVAQQYPKIDSLAALARLRAAERLMDAVQRGVPVGTGPGETDAPELSDDERGEYLDRAERLYREVFNAEGDRANGSTVFVVKALNGLAAVAEARGDMETAKTHYQQAAERAQGDYPELAAQARHRAETVDVAQTIVVLPTAAERRQLAQPGAAEERDPVSVDSAFRDLLLRSGG